MATPSFGVSEFGVGYCPECNREVLTHIDLGPADDEIRRCLHCDGMVTADVKYVPTDHIEAAGYVVVEAKTCGNGGGCSAGGCGIRSGS